VTIALLCDVHYGVRNDSPEFLDNKSLFLNEVFFPTLDKENIKTVICLGDLLDRRKYVNYYTAWRLRNDFMEPLRLREIDFHWILGNHDVYWRETNEISAASELYQYMPYADNFHFYKNSTEVVIEHTPFLFVPWICKENREQTLAMINNTTSKFCLGHLELAGFEMYKGAPVDHGDDPKIFERFDLCCTGHYHHRSKHNNIFYLGATTEFTWSDYNDPRGFCLLDIANNDLCFIDNPYTMFSKVYYHDAPDAEARKPINFGRLKDKIVKVIVQSRTDNDKYNTFMAQVEAAQPLELTVVDDHLNMDQIDDGTIVSDTKDTLTILRDYIKQTNNQVDAFKLEKLVVDLYKEAQSGSE